MARDLESAGTTASIPPVCHLEPMPRVAPGQQASTFLEVFNAGSTVEKYALSVCGEARRWTTIEPDLIRLFPRERATARIVFSVPATGGPPAGHLPVGIRVVNTNDPGGTVVEEGVLEIEGLTELTVDVRPHVARAHSRARHRVLISNEGNVPARVNIEPDDPDERLEFRTIPPVVVVPPGQTAAVVLRTRLPRTSVLRGNEQVSFRVSAAYGGHHVDTTTSVRQVPLVPRFALALAVVGLIAAAVLVAVTRSDHIESVSRVFTPTSVVVGTTLAPSVATTTPAVGDAATTTIAGPSANTPTTAPAPHGTGAPPSGPDAPGVPPAEVLPESGVTTDTSGGTPSGQPPPYTEAPGTNPPPVAGPVYVHVAMTGNDQNPGTQGAPMRTVSAAVAVAATLGQDVAVAVGDYDEGDGVALVSHVDIVGGFDASTWGAAPAGKTEISGRPQAIVADGDTDVVLRNLSLAGRLPATGGCVYGVRAINGSSLTLDHVAVTAAAAGSGASGANGNAGPAGGPGQAGGNGSCDGSTPGGGGAGGTSVAGRIGGHGGAGGSEGAYSGQPGSTGTGGTPGGGGGGGGDPGGTGGNGWTGAWGGTGSPGAAGSSGTGSAIWAGNGGGSGASGAAGNGGGGGGGGGGQGCTFCNNGPGNGGGGGGGGGQGGTGGAGGSAGGGSFAVYLYNSTVNVADSMIAAGNGGRGGNGGYGGTGGAGGAGGPGGAACTSEVGRGGAGGYGGQGGAGGAGGGGAGGPSVGVYRAGTSTATVTATLMTHGTGGAGGTSPGGTNGQPGQAADVL